MEEEQVNKEFRNLRLDQYRRFFGINRKFQIVSASQGEGCSELVDMALNFLPEGPTLYDEETICDQPLDNLLSDLVREQVLIPYPLLLHKAYRLLVYKNLLHILSNHVNLHRSNPSHELLL